ncbi:MAG TPA: hypothetical protein VJA26_06360 [Gammaproteobacteria bacterium]|nr:hypothetical protein [Gammaproteobacteria bacterium]
MRTVRLTPSVLTGAIALLAAAAVVAQNAPTATTSPAGSGGANNAALAESRPRGPAPRLPDGTPDFAGVWVGGGPVGDIAEGLMPGEEIVLLPEAAALMKSRMAADDPEARCLPTGVPRVAPYPWRVVQTPSHGKATHLFFLFEGNIHSYRQIFMDGREHPQDLEPTWYGHSIGHWEDDTLVIETVGFNDQFWFDFLGHPHSPQLKTIERYTRTDLGTLENVTTIIDPGAYAKPFTIKFTATLRPGWELMEYICNENNQDVEHIRGPAGL